MKNRVVKIIAVVLCMSVVMTVSAFGAEPFRSEKDKVLFASINEEFIEKPLMGDPTEMGELATAFRIPSLLNTGDSLIAAIDMGATGADWGDTNVAIRRSLDQGETWTSPTQMVLSGAKHQAIIGTDSDNAAFYIDPLMAKADNGDILMMVDFFPESMGLRKQELLDKNLDAYVKIGEKSYLALYDGKAKVDDSKAKPGKPYTVREDGWVFTPDGEKTNYYLPQNHSSEYCYETIGDMYYAVGDSDYISQTPPMTASNPSGDSAGEQDIYVGNIYLTKNKPEFSLTAPEFVQKQQVGDESKTNKKYDAFGEYECTITKSAPLRAAVKCYLYVTKSTDNGATWSQPMDITSSVFTKKDGAFLGTAPGVGITLEKQKDGSKNGRIIMPLYALGSAAVIYSDDNGQSWTRTKSDVKNIDEWQLIELADGTLMSFGRQKKYDITPVSYSYDSGETWEKRSHTGLRSVRCQKSVVTYPVGSKYLPEGLDKTRQYVVSSHPSGGTGKDEENMRINGAITLGVVEDDNTITWLYERKILLEGQYDMLKENKNFFAYSCLAVLNDGTMGVFYEAQPTSYLTYTEFNLDWIMAGEKLEEDGLLLSSQQRTGLIVAGSVFGGLIVLSGVALGFFKVVKKKKQ